MSTATIVGNRTREAIPPERTGVSIGRLARIAGFMYLAIFVLWPLSTVVGRATIVVGGDAAMTAQNLVANEGLFRWGMAGQSIVILIEIVMAALLYVIFRPVSRSVSLAAAFARMSEGVIMAVNLVTAFIAMSAVGGAGYLAAFGREQLDAVGMLLLEANEFGDLVWGLFFALHLALLGYLVYRSGFFPKLLGLLLAIAGAGYLLQSVGTIVAPSLDRTLATLVPVLAVPGELAFALWLVIKRIDADAWNRRALEARLP